MSNILNEKKVFSTPFLSGYQELRIPILDSAGNSAWPALFPPEKISEIRETVGERHFSAQMMLNYIAPDKIRLDPGGIKFYDSDFDFQTAKIGDNLITGACVYWDPSSGRRHADNSVCALIYRDDKHRQIFLHDLMYMVVPDTIDYPLAYQCSMVLDFVRKHKLRAVSVETNGIGSALPEIMRETISGTGYAIQITPITNSKRKEDRILDALEPVLGTGRLYAHRHITQTPLISEMLAWTPVGGPEHDDGLDAVSGAILCAPVPVRAVNARLHNYIANTDFQL